MVPARAIFKLHDVVTKNHLDNIAKMLLVTGWIVTYAYIVEAFIAWYSGNRYELYDALVDRPRGTYAWVYWGVLFCNCVVVQALWSRRIRTNPGALFVIAAFVQVGMWSERFMLIITSLHRDFLPSSWRVYTPSWIDWTILAGTCSFFLLPLPALSPVRPVHPDLRAEGNAPRALAASRGPSRLERAGASGARRRPCVTGSSPSSRRPRGWSGRSFA